MKWSDFLTGRNTTEQTVYITENCLVSLIASYLETLYKEVGGFLIGKEDKHLIGGERGTFLALDVAPQIRTCKSGKSLWQPGNLQAFNSIIDTIKCVNFNTVIEYHSHITTWLKYPTTISNS